jgi:hypothetical protein
LVKQEMARSTDSTETATIAVPAPAIAYASQINSAQPVLHVANWLGNTNPSPETQPQLSFFNTSHPVRTVSYDGN